MIKIGSKVIVYDIVTVDNDGTEHGKDKTGPNANYKQGEVLGVGKFYNERPNLFHFERYKVEVTAVVENGVFVKLSEPVIEYPTVNGYSFFGKKIDYVDEICS